MLSAFTNCFKIPDLRKRIIFTFALLAVCRIGAYIPIPGIDSQAVQSWLADQAKSSGGGGSLLGMYDLFVGGALYSGAITAMGIMPYISASIIMQLATAVVPTMARLAKEGDVGRAKITQYSRYLAIAISLFQGMMLALSYENPRRLFQNFEGVMVPHPGIGFVFTAVLALTTASMLLMWIGEQISQRGIGNGVSLVITVGIVARLPIAIYNAAMMVVNHSLTLPKLAFMLVLAVAVIAGIIAVTQALRKIPIQYAKRIVGQKMTAGGQTFMPLKVNYSGVMPIIFAQALLMVPQLILQVVPDSFVLAKEMHHWAAALQRGSFFYYAANGLMIFIFSYFWVAMQFRPLEIADNLKKSGGYIPGIRPGQPTADFLDHAMNRITLPGALFLIVIAVIPDFLYFSQGLNPNVAQFFGGTSMLISVGVMLDTMRQVESQLLMRHYDGFLRKGRLRGRAASGAIAGIGGGALLEDATTRWIVIGFGASGVVVLCALIWTLLARL